MMKGIFIIYAPAIEKVVFDALDIVGAKYYTKFPYLHGVGGHAEPHLDTQTWPGSNMALLVVAEENMKNNLLNEIRKIKSKYLDEGIKAFVTNIEEHV